MSASPVNNRYDIVYLFDVSDGNPNGDPDAGNLPRLDPETGQGLVTDVCLKRKLRNFVSLLHNNEPPFEIYVKERAILNLQHERAYQALGVEMDDKKKKKKGSSVDDSELTAWMCANFFDIRSFGAVMTTGVNCGQVRGPIQISIARSIDPIVTAEHSLTRCAVTTEKEAQAQDGGNRTMGRKFTVPYGLYRTHIFLNAPLAQQTGFTEVDLDLIKRGLGEMFEHDRSAARGLMSACLAVAFKHESPIGNARATDLFQRVAVTPRNPGTPPRAFSDYEVKVNDANLPSSVSLEYWVAPAAETVG